MENESNTPADAGTDFVQPEQTDTAPENVYYDPDEDTVEDGQEGATEDEGPSEQEDPETEATPDEEPEGSDDEGEDAPEPELLELPDGTKLERDEVVKGYLRQSDYTRKTADVAQQRQTLEAESTRMKSISDAFIDQLSQMIPAAPDPALAYKDPNAYTQQKASHEAAVQRLQQIVQIGEQAQGVQKNVSDAEHRQKVAEENRKLVDRFPATASQKGRQAFFAKAAEAAQAAGFPMQELQGVTDHRMFIMAHYAALGMEAEKAKGKAQEKVAKAPPAAPNKPSQGTKPRQKPMPKRFNSVREAASWGFD